MSEKPTTQQSQLKPRIKKGLSLFTKTILVLLLVLVIITAAFVYNAWHQLNLSNTQDINTSASEANVEILTPAGANNSNTASTIFVPPAETASEITPINTGSSNNTATAASAPTPSDNSPAKELNNAAETPLLPVNTPPTPNNIEARPDNNTSNTATTAPAAATAPKKASTNKGFDNLF